MKYSIGSHLKWSLKTTVNCRDVTNYGVKVFLSFSKAFYYSLINNVQAFSHKGVIFGLYRKNHFRTRCGREGPEGSVSWDVPGRDESSFEV